MDLLDFDQDEVFGIFNRRLELIALAHLAHAEPHAGRPEAAPMSEFGVSVIQNARGRGFGARLFEHAMLHARNRGVQTLFIVNLQPKRMAGETSEGMLFDLGYADGVLPALAVPERPVPNGTRAG